VVKAQVEAYSVPMKQRDLARRRTEFLIKQISDFDMPLRTALSSAYFQGMEDLFEVARPRLSESPQ
jgi:hypothetical protein